MDRHFSSLCVRGTACYDYIISDSSTFSLPVRDGATSWFDAMTKFALLLLLGCEPICTVQRCPTYERRDMNRMKVQHGLRLHGARSTGGCQILAHQSPRSKLKTHQSDRDLLLMNTRGCSP